MLEWHENALQRLRPVEPVQDPPKNPNTTEEVESLPDSPADDHSIVDAGDYFDSHHRARSSSSTRPNSSSSMRPSSAASVATNLLPLSPPSHRPHHLKAFERPLHGEFRRRSHSGEPSFREDPWSRDGPTPTEFRKSRTPQKARPRTSSRATSSEDESFTTSEALQSPIPAKPKIQPSYVRRHSAHSPYEIENHVPPIDYSRKNTLSPPFYAHQRPKSQAGSFRNIPAPPKNTNVRWRGVDYRADSSYALKDPPRSRLSVRYVDGDDIDREDRIRRRSMEPSRRKYVSEASDWR